MTADESSGTASAAAGALPAASTQPKITIADKVNEKKLYREIGREAVLSLSTAKPGNGVDELRDDNKETYWQSDGGQPHLINVQFHKKMSITELAFYLDYSLDESYTPKKMSIRSGTTNHDLVEVRVVELHEPVGWVTIPLRAKDGGLLRAFFLQVCVVSMHQNGRDTHVRQAKVFGPRIPIDTCDDKSLIGFSTTEMTQFSVLR